MAKIDELSRSFNLKIFYSDFNKMPRNGAFEFDIFKNPAQPFSAYFHNVDFREKMSTMIL